MMDRRTSPAEIIRPDRFTHSEQDRRLVDNRIHDLRDGDSLLGVMLGDPVFEHAYREALAANAAVRCEVHEWSSTPEATAWSLDFHHDPDAFLSKRNPVLSIPETSAGAF